MLLWATCACPEKYLHFPSVFPKLWACSLIESTFPIWEQDMHEWLGKSVLNNEQTVGWPSVHWPCTQSTGMVCELCWFFYRFFNWIQYTFFPCLEVRPGNMFHGVFLFDFFSHWMGFTFENYLLQINFVKTTHSLMSTCHYFSLSLWYPAFSPQPSKSGIVFPNSQPTTHYPWSILQPELFKVRHWGNSHCCWSTTDRKAAVL